MLINTYLDTEDFVHLYYTEDEAPAQGCGAGARMASKYTQRPPSPDYNKVAAPSTSEMTERERYRPLPCPEPPPHRVRASDLYPRGRTHFDEPGLNMGFVTICGESVQWVGRTADGGTISVSNYRLHVQPKRRNGPGASVPLRLIDAVEIRDLLHLIILCKHGRQIKSTFTTSEQCLEWWRRLNSSALAPINSVQETFAAAYAAWAKEQTTQHPTSSSSAHIAIIRVPHSPTRQWFGSEVERLGFTARGAWRVSAANADFKLCPSYPPFLVVPSSIGDEDLDSVARFRAMRRIPTVVWRHRGNGAVIARSSQPEVGWLGWRSSEDERLLAAFVAACNADRGQQPSTANKNLKLLIVDARSYASAVTNRARGGGCECQQYYPNSDIQFMSLPNIHHVRRSFQQLRALTAEPSDQANWHSNLERTLWLQYVAGAGRAAGVVARGVLAARPALVHCSDGWDRTPQITAAAQLQLDPYYRTVQGFRTLIEREWLDFGHKFADRCGHQFGPEDPNERSPIFIQWLDLVHQMMLQYPCSFEFNEAYLIKLACHVHSCMFGTFLCNTLRQRTEARAGELAAVWDLLSGEQYINHLYSPNQAEVLWPEYGVRSMQFWSALFCADRVEPDDEQPEASTASPKQHTNGLMTKTRSCDNLLNETEKITMQRRCSDPNIAPDVLKLSSIMSGDVEDRSRPLTDSCLDDLPLLPVHEQNNHDQVDGLHPDHFENSRLPRDIASGSSSLERELTSNKVIEHSSETETERSDMSDHMVESVVENMVNNVVENGVDLAESVIRVEDTQEGPSGYVCDTFNDVIGLAEAAREIGRTRNVSITWRSVSESSNQSSAAIDILDLPAHSRAEPQPTVSDNSRTSSHESSPIDNHNSTEGDAVNHNLEANPTNHDRENGVVNGTVNGVHEVTTKLLEVELNGGARGCLRRRRRHRASQLTLCPASPTHLNTSSTSSGAGESACWCGSVETEPEPADGLPATPDPTQARLRQIILHQKKVVEELCGQLREARQALRLMSPPPAAPSLPENHQAGSAGGGAGAACGAACAGGGSCSTSESGSASEVEVGEEARGVVWLPDTAAPRCQHCRTSFWLARRRHHCRRCGGIFCASCSEMSAWGSMGTVRMCTRCRTR